MVELGEWGAHSSHSLRSRREHGSILSRPDHTPHSPSSTMALLLATTDTSTTTTPAISLPGIPSLSSQWETARLSVFRTAHLEAARKHQQEAEEAMQKQLRRQEALNAQVIADAAAAAEARTAELAREAQAKAEAWKATEEAEKAAAEFGTQNPEDIDVTSFPKIIADAKRYGLDPKRVAAAERVYREKAVAAFAVQLSEDRLLTAVYRQRADKGAYATDAQRVVVRAVPVPLPVVVTARTIVPPRKDLEDEGDLNGSLMAEKKDRFHGEAESDDERSTSASTRQASPRVDEEPIINVDDEAMVVPLDGSEAWWWESAGGASVASSSAVTSAAASDDEDHQ